MDGNRFDDLARRAAASGSRRSFLRAALGLMLGGAVAAGAEGAEAAGRGRVNGSICTRGGDCQSRYCTPDRVCACPAGREECNGACFSACHGGLGRDENCTCACPPGKEMCGHRCVDVQNDSENCGGCHQRCVTGACHDGQCCFAQGHACSADYQCCGGACTNGQCCKDTSASCSANSDCCSGNCQNGACGCPAGQVLCGGTCCASGSCCNGACCPNGQTCDALGACGKCNANEETCGDVCCPTSGGPCCHGLCCPQDLFYCTANGCGNCFTDADCSGAPNSQCLNGICAAKTTTTTTTAPQGCTGVRGNPTAESPCCPGLINSSSSCDSVTSGYCLIPQTSVDENGKCVPPPSPSPRCTDSCQCSGGAFTCVACVDGYCILGGGPCTNQNHSCTP